jgi:hypothetical protein
VRVLHRPVHRDVKPVGRQRDQLGEQLEQVWCVSRRGMFARRCANWTTELTYSAIEDAVYGRAVKSKGSEW